MFTLRFKHRAIVSFINPLHPRDYWLAPRIKYARWIDAKYAIKEEIYLDRGIEGIEVWRTYGNVSVRVASYATMVCEKQSVHGRYSVKQFAHTFVVNTGLIQDNPLPHFTGVE